MLNLMRTNEDVEIKKQLSKYIVMILGNVNIKKNEKY